MLMLAGRAADEKEARALMEGVIEDGSALDKFAQFVRAQGGDAAPVYDTSLLPVAGRHWRSRQKRADMCTGFWRKTSELPA